jgi:Peptidase A4 family
MRRKICAIVAGAVLVVPAILGTAGAASAATTTVTQTNFNWAGYLAQTGNTPTQALGTYVQPAIKCAKGESSSVGFWVGVSNSTGGGAFAQDGTSAFCYDGKPGYYLWWETVGRPAAQGGGDPVPVLNTNQQGVSVAPAICKESPKFTGKATPSLKQLAFLVNNKCVTPIEPGYTIGLSVDVAPNSYAVFSAYIPQTGFELNSSQTFSNVAVGGAEWIVETQFIGSGLSDFGKVAFSDCYAYTGNNPGQPISDFNDVRLNLIYDAVILYNILVSWKTAASSGALTAPVSFDNGTEDGFSVSWHNHGLPPIAYRR